MPRWGAGGERLTTTTIRARGTVALAGAALVVLALVTLLAGPAAGQRAATCFGKEATIVRGEGDNTIQGTAGADVIVAGGGDDVIYGRGGGDRICAGPGRDTVIAGAGADRVSGGGGNDSRTVAGWVGLNGNAGRDLIWGDGGDDVIWDDANANNLAGTKADGEELRGGPGRDALYSNDGGGDKLFGQGGNDRLTDGGLPEASGIDTLNGGPATDVCDTFDDRDVRISCENGP